MTRLRLHRRRISLSLLRSILRLRRAVALFCVRGQSAWAESFASRAKGVGAGPAGPTRGLCTHAAGGVGTRRRRRFGFLRLRRASASCICVCVCIQAGAGGRRSGAMREGAAPAQRPTARVRHLDGQRRLDDGNRRRPPAYFATSHTHAHVCGPGKSVPMEAPSSTLCAQPLEPRPACSPACCQQLRRAPQRRGEPTLCVCCGTEHASATLPWRRNHPGWRGTQLGGCE